MVLEEWNGTVVGESASLKDWRVNNNGEVNSLLFANDTVLVEDSNRFLVPICYGVKGGF